MAAVSQKGFRAIPYLLVPNVSNGKSVNVFGGNMCLVSRIFEKQERVR